MFRPGISCIALLAGLLASALFGVRPSAAGNPPSKPLAGQNVLILLADDFGVDMYPHYAIGQDLPSLPTLDSLAQGGLVFRNAWGSPLCSPARACLLTGRYCFRTGLGTVLGPGQYDWALLLNEFTLPEALSAGSAGAISHAVIGKWHLGNQTVGGALAPNRAGFGHSAGILANTPGPNTHWSWQRVVDGQQTLCKTWSMQRNVDDALDWIHAQHGPWVLYFALMLPHSPYQAPPAGTYTTDLSGAGSSPRPYYKAMCENMDHEIQRLFDGMGSTLADTNVIFTADNGTPGDVIAPPFNPLKAKGSLFEPGVHVPLVISGPAVQQPGSDCLAMVSLVDIYATTLQLCGIDMASVLPAGTVVDGIGMAPYLADANAPSLRSTLFAEIFSPNGMGPYKSNMKAIRSQTHKLVRTMSTPPADALFDLVNDPLETTNLIQGGQCVPGHQGDYDTLQTMLLQVLGS